MRSPSDSQAMNGPMAAYSAPVYNVPNGAYGGTQPAMPIPPAARSLPTLLGLLNALKRRWVLAGFLGMLVGMAAAAGVWIASPSGRHQVKALVEVVPMRTMMNNGEVQNENFDAFKRNQEVLIKTRTLLNRVASSPRVVQLPLIDKAEDPAALIESLIRVRWDGADLMTISMNGDDPGQLRIILDTLIESFEAESSTDQQRERDRQRELYRAIIKDYKIKIEQADNFHKKVTGSGKPADAASIATYNTHFNQMLSSLESSKLENQRQLFEANGIINRTKAELAGLDKKEMSNDRIDLSLANDQEMKALRLRVEAARKIYDETKQLTEKFPDSAARNRSEAKYQEAQAELDRARDAKRGDVEKRLKLELRDTAEREISSLTKEIELKKDRQKDLEASILDTQDKLEAINRDSNLVSKQTEDLKPLRDSYVRLQEKLNELDVWARSSDGQGRIRKRDVAQITMNFNQKQKMVFSATAGLLSFFGVMGLVAYLEWRSRRVDSVDQVVNELNLRIIGTIPAFPSRASLKAGEADQNQNWRFILNESVNSTRTMLLHTAKTQSMQVIMVTSAMQGEGKTSLSSQLATSMATAGLRTLILDCDLRNPSMHKLFDVTLTPGCSELLLGAMDVTEVVQPTTVPNLWMIPAGQCSNRVIAALAQGHPLESLFNRLRGDYDFIVVDSCPVLPVADSLLVGQHVDGVLISILQDISQLPKVLNASERLTQLNIPVLGAVVNGIKTDIHAYGYNYVKQLPA